MKSDLAIRSQGQITGFTVISGDFRVAHSGQNVVHYYSQSWEWTDRKNHTNNNMGQENIFP